MIGLKNVALRSHWSRPPRPSAPALGPAPHSQAFAQHSLPGRTGFALSLRHACAPQSLVQPPRRLRGRRLPARQGLCGRRGRGQAGEPAPTRPTTPESKLIVCMPFARFPLFELNLCVPLHGFHVPFA